MTDNIVVKNLCKSFGEKAVLKNFSAEIPREGITCLTGPSGCGKTTFLNILLGLERTDTGKIDHLPSRFSAVFQEDRLCEEFSVEANLRLVCPRNADREQLRKILESLGIGDCLKKKISELSGGMKRRVAIARALLAEGEMIVMDEPFKGLDEETRKKVIGVLKRSARPMLIVTHDREDIDLLGAREIRMRGAE